MQNYDLWQFYLYLFMKNINSFYSKLKKIRFCFAKGGKKLSKGLPVP